MNLKMIYFDLILYRSGDMATSGVSDRVIDHDRRLSLKTGYVAQFYLLVNNFKTI